MIEGGLRHRINAGTEGSSLVERPAQVEQLGTLCSERKIVTGR